MTAFILCTRTDSSRLPNKPFMKINGETILENLVKRLLKTKFPVILAYPRSQKEQYEKTFKNWENVILHASGYDDDPLKRMYEAAKQYSVNNIIRVSHDKILVEPQDVLNAIKEFQGYDYLYSSKFIAGTGFEIISFEALKKAASIFKKVEYIGYSIRQVTTKVKNWNPLHPRGEYRFLIDYESDAKMLEVLFTRMGNDCKLREAVAYLNENPEIKEINKLPKLTIYTCAYNAEKWIGRCMESVARSKHFKDYEYIIIDDHSKDTTCELIAKFAQKHTNVFWYRNDSNKGLSSSSNLALKKARGKYIMRLDADDYFVSVLAPSRILKEIQERELEALYPNNYFGSLNVIQKGSEHHHVGGSLFLKDAINHIKFTDGLKHHDSLDIFTRAKDCLKIGYMDYANFFYYQHDNSMSKKDLHEREKIKEKILTKQDYLDFINDEEEVDLKELGVEIEPSH
jgi:spore coat polysaccharide biosynthesis protein SpsF (cytidylyltransferase family)